MIKRFIAGLTSPTKTASYIDDKWYMPILVVLFMVLLYLIPSIYYAVNDEILTYEVQREIRGDFVSGSLIEYKIENGRLIYTGSSGENSTFIDSDLGRFIFANTTIEYSQISKTVNYLFRDEGVTIIYGGLKVYFIPFADYPSCEGLDFKDAKSDDITFWNTIFTLIQQEIDNNKGYFVSATVTYNVLYLVVEILIYAVFLAFVLKMQSKISYGKAYKLSIYLTVPTFIGIFMAVIYSVYFFSIIGMLCTIVYVNKMGNVLHSRGGF